MNTSDWEFAYSDKKVNIVFIWSKNGTTVRKVTASKAENIL